MGALLDDLAVVEHGDLITELAGGQPVADINCSLIARDLVELCVDLRFSHRVQGGGRLIQHDERCILVQGPGNGDLLGLAARDGHAILVQIFIKAGVQPLGHPGQPVGKARFLQAVGGTGDIIMLGRGNILAQRQGEQLEILEHHREDIHVLIVAVLTDVDAVEQDDTLGGVV